MIFSSASRARVREAERLWVGKFVLRILCWVSSLIALAVAAYSFSFTVLVGLIWIVIIPLSASLVWNAANIIVRLSRARPIHPGANVGLDLVIWLGFIVGLAFTYIASIVLLAASDGSFYARGRSICRSSDYYSYGYSSSSSYSGSECRELLQRYGAAGIASAVFGTISLILHFVLFVWACVDTSHRNRDDHQRAAIMAAGMVAQMQHQSMPPGGYPPPQGGYYPPQPQQQPYPQGQYPPAPPQAYGANNAGAPPPGVGPAYAQHQSFYDATGAKGPTAYSSEHARAASESLAPGEPGVAHSPAVSSVSPVARSDENQPEVAAYQPPRTY